MLTKQPMIRRLCGVVCALALLSAGGAAAGDAVGTGAADQRTRNLAGGGLGVGAMRAADRAAADVGRRAQRLARAEPVRSPDAKLRRLTVRVGVHRDFTRLVFDWPTAVSYSLTESDDSVTVIFGTGARIDLRRLRAQVDRGLANPRVRLRDGRLIFTIDKPADLKVRHFLVGPKVVLDFGAGPPQAVDAKPERDAGPAGRRGAESPSSAPPPRSRPPQTVEPVGPPAGARPPYAAAPDTPPGVESAAAAAARRAGAAPSTGAVITFELPGPSGAAVFRREPYLWIVFDQRIRPSTDALRDAAAGLIDDVALIPAGTATAIRLRPKLGINPMVERDGDKWLVRLRRWPIAPPFPIALGLRSDGSAGSEAILADVEAGRIVRLADPEVGDTLLIATSGAAGQGIPDRRRYPQFELLPSAQGVAVKPLDDSIELRAAGKGVVVMTRANGLHLSAAGPGRAVSGVETGPRMFDFADWSNGPAENYAGALQAARRAASEAPKGQRDEARLDLARLYFAHGMAPEALGVLRALETARSPLAAQPEFGAIKGASLAYMGRHVEAREALLDRSLDGYREIALWRASMYYHAGEAKRAADHFRAGDAVLRIYPEPYRTALALQQIEAGISARDAAISIVWTERLDKRADKLMRRDLARLLYFQGVLARQRRDLDRAVKHWQDAKATGDRWNGARAEFALVELGLQQQAVSAGEAIERLERLSFEWRGDELEQAVLGKLGRLYLAEGEYRRGLARLRSLVAMFSGSDASKAAAETMAATFRSLFLDGKADTLPPPDALALFDEFRDLTPAGPDGDVMIRRLVDRLIGADALDKAAALLSHQVRHRLSGEEKAKGGAKLALIHLLDRKPKAALSALRTSHLPGLPQAVEDDRRRIRTKAMLDLGRSEEALALLAGDTGIDADLLRLDLYWNAKQYAEAAKVLKRLAGEPSAAGTYGAERAQYVLGLAVALRLERDEAGLKALRERYGAGMEGSRLADSFAYIVQSAGGSREDIEAFSRRVIEADGFAAFLRNYRERLMPPTTAVSTEKRIQGEPESRSVETPAADKGIPPPPPPR